MSLAFSRRSFARLATFAGVVSLPGVAGLPLPAQSSRVSASPYIFPEGFGDQPPRLIRLKARSKRMAAVRYLGYLLAHTWKDI